MKTIYHIDSSANATGSNGRKLARELVSHLESKFDSKTVYRDVSQGLEFLSQSAFDGLYLSDDTRTEAQKQALKLSDQLAREMIDADYIVISAPLYNFGPPAGLKAWADLVARKDLTFGYDEKGYKGLLQGKKAFVIFTSGGVPVGSARDFLSSWIKTFLSYIGITDVQILAADQLFYKGEANVERVRSEIRAVA